MTTYVQSTNFATKDALASGNPLKIVRGSEINTEFNNIALAINGNTTADQLTYTPAGTGAVATTVQTKLRESVSRADYTSDANYDTARNALMGHVDLSVMAASGTADRLLSSKLGEVISVKDFGAAVNNANDDTTAIVTSLTTAAATVAGAQGSEVFIPQGTALTGSAINIHNRVSIRGANKRGSIFKAKSGFSGGAMFTVVNGTSSMFDNALKDLTVNCSDIVGVEGVLSDAWQEGGGLKNCLIQAFREYGVRFRNGYGGAALCEIDQSEIFGSSVVKPTAGIRVNVISAVGSFMLRVTNSTISNCVNGIMMDSDSLHAQNVHFEDCSSGIVLDGPGLTVLIGVTGGPGVTNVVELASTFTGSLKMIGCRRSSATNLLKDNRAGGYGTISIDTDIEIKNNVTFGSGLLNSFGVFDGTSINTTFCKNVASISRAAAGDYTINESVARPSAYGMPFASCNITDARITVDLIGTSSYRIRIYNASGVLADSNEIKFMCVRLT